jgi:hypothetical protein
LARLLLKECSKSWQLNNGCFPVFKHWSMTRLIGILSLLVIILLTGCGPERKLARQYVKLHTGSGIMIVPTNELFKDNLSINYDPSQNFSPEQLDSIAWVQSFFVKHISDSVFLTLFTNKMIEGLTSEGYDVYLDGSSDVFLSLPDPKWVVQIAQLQLNEKHLFNEYEIYSIETGEPYVDSIKVNQMMLSSWLEVSRANTSKKQVLYLEGYVEDNVKRGVKFNVLEGSVGKEETRDSIGMNDVYKMAYELGQKHAEFLFDYFMNEYIRENLPAGYVKKKYFYFDRKSNNLKQGNTDRFEIIE